MIEKWQVPQDFTSRYVESVKKAVTDNLYNFRRNPEICTVIENSTFDGAKNDIAFINRWYADLWRHVELFRSSDSVGNPDIFYFERIGNFSPSTIRYIKALGDLINNFGHLTGFRIVEIGAGYGGLCKLIHDVFSGVQYYLYDLEPCLTLQEKFLNRFGINPIKLDLEHECYGQYDLVIACCSWSELHEQARIEYIEKVIKKAKYGYFINNYDTEYDRKLLMKYLPDKTYTTDANNYAILTFK